MTDVAVGAINLEFLKNLRSLYDTFAIHEKGRLAKSKKGNTEGGEENINKV